MCQVLYTRISIKKFSEHVGQGLQVRADLYYWDSIREFYICFRTVCDKSDCNITDVAHMVSVLCKEKARSFHCAKKRMQTPFMR